MKDCRKFYIDGKWVDPTRAHDFTIINPANEEPIATISLGATEEPIELSAFQLLFQSLGVQGALTGTPAAGDATLRFSTISKVAAMVETMPLERAAEAYAKMMSGKARFRMVLVTKNGAGQGAAEVRQI